MDCGLAQAAVIMNPKRSAYPEYVRRVWLVADTRCRDEEDKDAKARRVVRANNFTQQTNVLDVDKHMCVIPWRMTCGPYSYM